MPASMEQPYWHYQAETSPQRRVFLQIQNPYFFNNFRQLICIKNVEDKSKFILLLKNQSAGTILT